MTLPLPSTPQETLLDQCNQIIQSSVQEKTGTLSLVLYLIRELSFISAPSPGLQEAVRLWGPNSLVVFITPTNAGHVPGMVMLPPQSRDQISWPPHSLAMSNSPGLPCLCTCERFLGLWGLPGFSGVLSDRVTQSPLLPLPGGFMCLCAHCDCCVLGL